MYIKASFAFIYAKQHGMVVVVALVGLLGAIGRPQAASISFSASLSTKTQPGFVSQFNPSLGTLTEVDFTAAGRGGSLVTASASSVPFSGTFLFSESFFGVFPGGGFDFGSYIASGLPFTSLGGGVDLEANFNFSTALTTGLTGFIGTGVINLQTSEFAEITSPAVQQSLYLSAASGIATVTYQYTPAAVPEPPGLVTAGIAMLAGMGFRLCRRSHRAA
jgi:hypothetical protein